MNKLPIVLAVLSAIVAYYYVQKPDKSNLEIIQEILDEMKVNLSRGSQGPKDDTLKSQDKHDESVQPSEEANQIAAADQTLPTHSELKVDPFVSTVPQPQSKSLEDDPIDNVLQSLGDLIPGICVDECHKTREL
jgi:hypothetical protein